MIRILTFLCSFLIFSSCSNDDDNNTLTPLEQLPPATQNGAQTFGCLVNGKTFIPPNLGKNSPRAFYQFVRGAYTLGISAAIRTEAGLISISVNTLDTDLIQDSTTYMLKERASGNFFGTYDIYDSTLIYEHTSRSDNPGSLAITNFDQENGIISGTFEFTAIGDDGKSYKITEGRFDLNYTN